MNRKKLHMRRRRRRFFSSIFLLIIIGLTFTSVNSSIARGSESPHYIQVTVQTGDTIWKIAKNNANKERDIRDLVYEIREINNLSTANLKPGQIVKIPTIQD